MFRNGIGYSSLPLQKNKPLILGGADIDSTSGVESKYGSDLLVLSICDALIGAANLGDFRDLFPEDKYGDMSSLKILEIIRIKIQNASLQIIYIDSSIICPELDLTGQKTIMKLNLSRALELDKQLISVKSSPVFICPDTNSNITVVSSATIVEFEEQEEEADSDNSDEDYYD